MNRCNLPDLVWDKLLAFDQAVEHLTRRAAKTRDGIANARTRLTGGFEKDSEYRDTRAALGQMVKDLPAIEQKLHAARRRLASCKTFVDELPDDAMLEPVKVNANGRDLAEVRQRRRAAEDELKAQRAVPVPSPDIKERVRKYVASQTRPKITGIDNGQLEVLWPNSTIAVLALLLPDEMANALLSEVDRAANSPMPLDARKKRISELVAQINTLQRQELALDPDARGLPPEVILGVKVVRREQAKRVERREHAA